MKKLSLTKETLGCLNSVAIGHVRGGMPIEGDSDACASNLCPTDLTCGENTCPIEPIKTKKMTVCI